MRTIGWAIVAGAILLFSAQASAQTLDLAAVNAAYDAGDLATLERASKDDALIASVAAQDPEAAIDLLLSIARRLSDSTAAIAAYQRVIESIEQSKGPGEIALAEPLKEMGLLQLKAGDRAMGLASLRRAVAVVAATMGDEHELVADYRAAYEEAAGTPYAPPATRGIGRPKQPYHLVQIYYATHRSPSGSTAPATYFGGQPGPLRFGTVTVSLPNDREVGELPTANIFALEFRPDPAKHVVLTSVRPMGGRAEFLAAVSKSVSASRRKEVFVFIHGFNNGFAAAAERTAQLADDLAIDGAPILYSWPSKGSPLAYNQDEAEAGNAAQIADLAGFLTDVARQTGAFKVNLVAHSMGNRFLTRALAQLAARPPAAQPRFDEVVLAAPDVGIDEFTRLWPRIRPLGARFTLYASKRDKALELSGQIHNMLRLGDARRVTPIDQLETVDTTSASGGLLGHSDFAGTALDDFRAVVWASLAPDKRCVLQTAPSGPRFWVFTPAAGAACPDNEFRSMLAYIRTAGSPAAALQRVHALAASGPPEQRARLQGVERRLVQIYGAAPPS